MIQKFTRFVLRGGTFSSLPVVSLPHRVSAVGSSKTHPPVVSFSQPWPGLQKILGGSSPTLCGELQQVHATRRLPAAVAELRLAPLLLPHTLFCQSGRSRAAPSLAAAMGGASMGPAHSPCSASPAPRLTAVGGEALSPASFSLSCSPAQLVGAELQEPRGGIPAAAACRVRPRALRAGGRGVGGSTGDRSGAG